MALNMGKAVKWLFFLQKSRDYTLKHVVNKDSFHSISMHQTWGLVYVGNYFQHLHGNSFFSFAVSRELTEQFIQTKFKHN